MFSARNCGKIAKFENLINAAETGGGWLMFARIAVRALNAETNAGDRGAFNPQAITAPKSNPCSNHPAPWAVQRCCPVVTSATCLPRRMCSARTVPTPVTAATITMLMPIAIEGIFDGGCAD